MERPQHWRKFGFWDTLNIKETKIIHTACQIVCERLKLRIGKPLNDSVGVRAYVLEDSQDRRYFLVAKRYVAIINNQPTVSINKNIVEACKDFDMFIILWIEQGNYIYTFDPKEILKTGWVNQFNMQNMVNFNINLAKNMELTRTRKTKPASESSLVKYIKQK